MTINEALKSLPVAGRRRIRANLRRLSSCSGLAYQAVLNFYCESRFTYEDWEMIFKRLLDESNPILCRKFVGEAFRLLALRGPKVQLALSCRLGRAVTVGRFCRLLVKLGYFASVSSARRAVRNMLSKPVDILTRRWKNYALGVHLMWSTLNPDGGKGSPFEGIGETADEMRGVLGLDRNEFGLPLILFEYILPSGTAGRFPTVAEAYAGEEWPYFFRPAPVGAPYGMTMPWPEFEKSPPRPEIVHEVLSAEFLTSPLREIS